MVIAIDFDDTIAYSNYPDILGIKPNAAEVIGKMHNEGNDIIVWTCRLGEPLEMAEAFLKENKILHHTVNKHIQRIMDKYGNDTRKIYADVYIDDKNLGGIPDDWNEIYEMVKQHPLYGKHD
jgi:hypothetical protein